MSEAVVPHSLGEVEVYLGAFQWLYKRILTTLMLPVNSVIRPLIELMTLDTGSKGSGGMRGLLIVLCFRQR